MPPKMNMPGMVDQEGGAPMGDPAATPDAGPDAATTAKESFTVDKNQDGTFTVSDNMAGEAGAQNQAPQNFQSVDDLFAFLGKEFGAGDEQADQAGPEGEAAPAEGTPEAPAAAPAKKMNPLSTFFSKR
ncbi:hypothetical protein CCP3SC15_1550006 [Gammaproteobacteria bacterium]